MASFSSFKLTSKGLDLEYKAQMGKSLKFTKFELGDGELGLTPIKELTSLKHTVLSRNITKLEKNNSKVTIGFMLDNKELTEGFYWKEIGIFAKDPDTKEEILFMYSTAGETADYIPAFNSGNMLEKYIDVDILLSDVEEVQATIESSLVYVTNQDFEKNKEDFDGKLNEKVNKEALDIKYGTFSEVSANLENSAEAYMKSFNLEGVIDQETREGYNKLNISDKELSITGNGTVVYSIKNGIITINGTPVIDGSEITEAGPVATSIINCEIEVNDFKFLPNKNYTIALDFNKTIEDSSMVLSFVDSLTEDATAIEFDITKGSTLHILNNNEENKILNNYFILKNKSEVNMDDLIIQIMILEGEYSLENLPLFESYGAMPSMKSPSNAYGLGDDYNLLNITTLVNPTHINNGITLSKVEEGILLNGTATSTAIFELTAHIKYPEGDYRLSGCPEGGAEDTYRLDTFLNKGAKVYVDIGNGINFHIDNGMTANVRIRIQAGTTVNNLLFKPMLIKGSEEKPYIPYKSAIIKMSNETNEKKYKLNFGNLTLYEGEIPYIEGDKVYYNKKWFKYVFTGNEAWKKHQTTANNCFYCPSLFKNNPSKYPGTVVYSNRFLFCQLHPLVDDNIGGISVGINNEPYIGTGLDGISTVDELKTYLQNNETYILYELATPVKTEITGELAEQIKNLYKSIHTYEGITNIELQGYGKMNGEYLVNTEFAKKVMEIGKLIVK